MNIAASRVGLRAGASLPVMGTPAVNLASMATHNQEQHVSTSPTTSPPRVLHLPSVTRRSVTQRSVVGPAHWLRRALVIMGVAGAGLLGAACAGSGAVSSLDGVASATIRIEVDGIVVEPEQGETSNDGTGSGFFISADG